MTLSQQRIIVKAIKTHKRVSGILGKVYTYFCPWTIFPDNCISCMACSRHFTSSVGHRTRAAKPEAKEPAAAFCRSLQKRNCRRYLCTGLQCSGATAPASSTCTPNIKKNWQTALRERISKETGSYLNWGDEESWSPIVICNSNTSFSHLRRYITTFTFLCYTLVIAAE